MKLNFDFRLPDNARIVISGYTTTLVVTLCVPKTFGEINFSPEYPKVHRGPKRFFIKKELVLVHLNRDNIYQSYSRMLKDLQVDARKMKQEVLTYEIKQLQFFQY